MTIDPSICDLGYALFALSSSGPSKRAHIILADNIAQHSSEDFTIRSDAAAQILTRIAITHKVSEVAIELPDHYSSAKGEAAKNSDAILKLIFQVATIRSTILSLIPSCEVILIPVRKWKGSQPKHLTQRRIRNHWHFENVNHNICDAVGIGDWLLRKRRGYRPTY